MFTLDTVIDTVQSGKKTFIGTFVTNETIKTAMMNFIDAQAAYTKEAARASTEMFTTVVKETVSAVQASTKFDYTKFGEGIVKAYTSQMQPK